MKVLIVGRGGREHAIAWKIAQSKLADCVIVAPGNDGIKQQFKTVNIAETDTQGLIDFVKKEQIDLTIVGPEAALLNGIADDFKKENLAIFAPSKAAAMIEGSKQFAKELMVKYKIPTADFQTFTDYAQALSYVKAKGAPIVIKYDGLAAGKGVVVAQSLDEATDALNDMLLNAKYGEGKVVIEEFLSGPEFSLLALVNGNQVVPLVVAQDHKRAYDHDLGPNTGGMGAYSPVPIISQEIIEQSVRTIMQPTANALVCENRPFTGILYGGLILTNEGPKVIEFNARFGDPETEVILPKMKSDLLQHILDVLNLKPTAIEWDDNTFLGVVLASKGYPESYNKGVEIKGLDTVNQLVFHMGTALKDHKWVTNGGRVLFVVGKGNNFEKARQDAYNGVDSIESEALFYRADIGCQMMNLDY